MTMITKKELVECIAIEEDEAEYLEKMARAVYKQTRDKIDSKFVNHLMNMGFSEIAALNTVRAWDRDWKTC